MAAANQLHDDYVTELEEANAKQRERILALEAENGRLADEAERLSDLFYDLRVWGNAYPLKIFPEPDRSKAAKVLEASGMTLDSVSSASMRHVLRGIEQIVNKALGEAS